jgi:electron transport complex protein RnfC
VKAISDAIQTGMPLIERVVTVTGERVKNPGNYIVKVGTDVKEVLDHCGGLTAEDVTVKMGGPMMGMLLPSLNVSVIKGTNGIIAYDTDHSQEVSCIKCGRCVDVCPMELTPLYFSKFHDEANWQGMKDRNVMDCIECRSCEYICSSKIPLVTKIKAGKTAVRGLK